MPLKYANNQSLTSTTALPAAVPTDNLILISTQTASASATISFTTGLNSTYDEYIFSFINIHPANDAQAFNFQCSTDGGSNYNVSLTSTYFNAFHDESDATTNLTYLVNRDQSNGTSFQEIMFNIGNDNDQNGSGFLTLFNPSSTTYVKHFISHANNAHHLDRSNENFVAGYFNTTSAINAIQFKMSSGNIDDGIIKMYGVKKS